MKKYQLPERFKGVLFDDILIVAKFPKTHKYTKDQRCLRGFRVVANDYLYNAFTQNGIAKIRLDCESKNEYKRIFRINGGEFDGCAKNIDIYADMLVPYRGLYRVKYGTFRFFSNLYDRMKEKKNKPERKPFW